MEAIMATSIQLHASNLNVDCGYGISHFSDKIKSYHFFEYSSSTFEKNYMCTALSVMPHSQQQKKSFNRTSTRQHTLNIPCCPRFFREVQGTLSWSAEFSLRLLSSLLDAYRDAIVAPTFYNLVVCDSLWNQGAPPSTKGLYESIWMPARRGWLKDTIRLHSRQIRVKANQDADGSRCILPSLYTLSVSITLTLGIQLPSENGNGTKNILCFSFRW